MNKIGQSGFELGILEYKIKIEVFFFFGLPDQDRTTTASVPNLVNAATTRLQGIQFLYYELKMGPHIFLHKIDF